MLITHIRTISEITVSLLKTIIYSQNYGEKTCKYAGSFISISSGLSVPKLVSPD